MIVKCQWPTFRIFYKISSYSNLKNDFQLDNHTYAKFFDYTFFYKQLDFPSEPGVANEILENEAKSCLAVA